jgi:hypothetical protein
MTITTDLTNKKFVKIAGFAAQWAVTTASPSLATPTTSMTVQGWTFNNAGNLQLQTLVILAADYNKVIENLNSLNEGYAN